MNREEKISTIYKEIANKELTFGCKILIDKEIATVIEEDKYWDWIAILREDWWVTRDESDYEFTEIGHPVMIWDVLDYFKNKRFYCTKCKKIVDWRDVSDDQLWGEYYCDICNANHLYDIEDDIIFYWFEKRKPIETQEDQCIDYIYNLIWK